MIRPPVPSLRSLFRSQCRRALPAKDQGFGHPVSPTGSSGTETTGSPEFPSDPLDACPAHIRPRWDRSARPFRHPRCCLPLMARRRLPQVVDFGALSHGLHLRCLRFAAAVTRAPRKTRFRAAATLTRTGLDPQDLFGRFPKRLISRHPFPLPRALLGARHLEHCSPGRLAYEAALGTMLKMARSAGGAFSFSVAATKPFKEPVKAPPVARAGCVIVPGPPPGIDSPTAQLRHRATLGERAAAVLPSLRGRPPTARAASS